MEVWYTQNILSGCSERELWETWDLQNDTKIDTNTKLLAIFKELYYITTCFMQRIAGSMKYILRTFLKNKRRQIIVYSALLQMGKDALQKHIIISKKL